MGWNGWGRTVLLFCTGIFLDIFSVSVKKKVYPLPNTPSPTPTSLKKSQRSRPVSKWRNRSENRGVGDGERKIGSSGLVLFLCISTLDKLGNIFL